MFNLKDRLMLTDKGYEDLKKAIAACTLTNLSMMIPFGATIQIFGELLKPLMGQEISWTRMWLLFGFGVAGAALVFLASKNDYKKTYIASYMESEANRIRVAEHIRKLPMSFFNQKNLSELTTNIMGDCATTEHVLSHIIPQLIANGISITIICLMLAIFDWRLALTVFCTVPVAFLIVAITRKIQIVYGEKHVQAKLDVSDQVQEYLEGIKVIKSCGLGGARFTVLKNALRLMKQMAIKMEFVYGVFITGAQVVLQAGIGLTVFVGTYLLTGGKIELVPLLMFFLIVVRIYGPLITELTLLPELLYMQISTSRMRTLFSVPVMEGDTETPIKDYRIELENVSFSYAGQKSEAAAVIRDMTVSIPRTASLPWWDLGRRQKHRFQADRQVLGRGRRFHQNRRRGRQDPGPEHLMSYMSFVFQDVVLFNDTVYNNIRIGNMDATEEQVLAAAKAACCDEFVRQLPEGYQTLLGENGSTLSGGERQRISIARALLKDAPIVLLDEATASLDPENEVYIQQAISKLIEGKTVIVIAHRLRTVAGADKIIVIDKGRAVEQGTHEQLIAQKGLYERLYTIQQQSLGWSV
jgi:ATP-binding cassette subfamily B protein